MITKDINNNKKTISNNIFKSLGLTQKYSEVLTDDLIDILKLLIKKDILNIKNFGTFKVLNKNERLGRNPKNKKTYKIKARKSLSFITSKKFNNKINIFYE